MKYGDVRARIGGVTKNTEEERWAPRQIERRKERRKEMGKKMKKSK